MKVFIRALRFFCILIIFFPGCISQQENQDDDFDEPTLNREKYLDWFRDAKFGMFIHWGPYSQLAGEWNGKQVPVGQNAEWIMKNLEIPVDEYRKIAKTMNPVEFDAQEWVRLAKSTGMKYIVITAKHHDGFAMYHSKNSPYNIVDWTEYKHDPLKELSKACEEAGIKFCFYYSHREDWEHPGGYGNDWDYDNDWGQDLFHPVKFRKYLEEKAKPQIEELLTGYGPIGLVWFDRGMYTREQGFEFVRLVNKLQPATLINGRVGHYNKEFIGDYQSTSDNGMPPGGLEEYWETPQTLNETWGYSKFDTLWKSPEEVIRRLVEVVSRGGNYLLNVGPKGNGEIPDTTITIFRKVGQWIERNSESIYGTTANPFGELPWGYCTVKEKKIYLLIRDWPEDNKLVLAGLKNPVLKAYPLNDRAKILNVLQDGEETYITIPSMEFDDPVSVIVLEVEGQPDVLPQYVKQDESGRIKLDYLTANTLGKAKTRFNRKGGFHISKWTNPDDAVEWFINIDKPGKFKIYIDYSAKKGWKGKGFEVTIGEYNLTSSVISTGEIFDYVKFPLGYIELAEPGKYTLIIKPSDINDDYLMYLKSIILDPVEEIKDEGWGVE